MVAVFSDTCCTCVRAVFVGNSRRAWIVVLLPQMVFLHVINLAVLFSDPSDNTIYILLAFSILHILDVSLRLIAEGSVWCVPSVWCVTALVTSRSRTPRVAPPQVVHSTGETALVRREAIR